MEINLKELEGLSPFELKDELIKAAEVHPSKTMLNAGRGNPNFLAVEPREAFFYLGLFALEESKRGLQYEQQTLGIFPILTDGIVIRFEAFVKAHSCVPGVRLLDQVVSFVRDQMNIGQVEFLAEITNAILGSNYPVPGRFLVLLEKVVAHYILKEMGADHLSSDDVDLFALEGGTSAMSYIFETLRRNNILNKGDKIALGMPIFQPYIEYTHLREYAFTEVDVVSTLKTDWQYTKEELDKLLDPEIKAFFLVNPTNPTSVRLSDEVLEHLAGIVKKRPDLIILTDDVYATFADDFKSIFAYCPKNTILVYSYSKYYGATGWRIGIVATHKENVVDKLIQKLPADQNKSLDERYSSLVLDPRNMKFIDRLMAESRTVALNHTSGLSLPQQVQMMLFSMFDYIDVTDDYKNNMKRMVSGRLKNLYKGLNLPCPNDPQSARYYHMLDVEKLGTDFYNAEFGKWLITKHKLVEIVYRLAKDGAMIFLPGEAFGIASPAFRVSLANLHEASYTEIGRRVREVFDAYYKEFKK